MTQDESYIAWLRRAKAHGWGRTLALLIDAAEPLGALGAQMLYVSQPVFGLFGLGRMIGGIAEALETPEGIAALRAALDEHDQDETEA
ncbi:MAG: hypothetical protein SF162_11370 [bacterium]|nr:hypothetical protein [bacterium]